MKHPRSVCALSLLVLLAFTPHLAAQAVNATLLGTVTDATGAVVADAKVLITEVNTGVIHLTQSNSSGNYTFPDLPPGTYTVTGEFTGFKKESRSGVLVDVNTSVRIDLQLIPGSVSETMEVTAATPALQTDRSDTGRKIETVQTASLPMATGRNFQSLLNLVPGTTPASYQHSQFFNAANSLQTEVNGQLRMGNNYQIEGIDDNERTGLLQILIPPAEAIQTVDVSTSNFEAELGRASGAVTNVILKSGANQIHGAAYEFLKNSDFNARNFFSPAVGHLAYNYVGGNVGGAILKNRLFFFADYLKVLDHEANTNSVSIPTVAMRTGDLSLSKTVIYDPTTGSPTTGAGRTPFAGNIISPTLINPISAKILALVPNPNQSVAGINNNYFALLPFTKDTDYTDGKVDFNLSDKDRLSGRFSFQRPVINQGPIFGLAGGPAQGAFAGTGVQKTYSTGINYNRIFSSTLIAEFRAGVAHYHNEAHNADYGTNTSANLGIPGINNDEFSSGIVGVNLNNGFSGPIVGYSASLPWIRAETNIDVANTWTKVLGNHTLKAGGDLRRVRDDLLQNQTYSPRGIYDFEAPQTSQPGAATSFYNNMASFLLDDPNYAGKDFVTQFPAYRAWQFFAFVQDKWIVSPKLTVDLGLRWEFYPPGVPRFNGGFSNYDPVNNQLLLAGIGGVPSNLGIKTRYSYFAPRVGMAYRVSENTVLRLGFGLSYTPFPDNSYAYNYPVRGNNVYNPTLLSYGPAILPNGAVATFENGFPPPTLPAIPTNGIITNPPSTTSYFVVNPNFKNPYVISYNAAFQQALPFHFTVDLGYVGNKGVDSVVNYNLNAATYIGSGNAGLPEYGFGKRTAATNLLFAGYSSMYNALQAKIDRRFTNGFSMTNAFTWGKGMSFQQGDDGGLEFYINQQRNWARTDFDRAYSFISSYIYELPFGPGKSFLGTGMLGNFLGGWKVSGILSVYSGTPVNLTANGASLNAPSNSQTPNQIAAVTFPKGINTGNPWFSTSSFAQPVGPVFGSVGRNAFSGPGSFNLDASLFKTFSITERMRLEVRAEGYSMTNTPQFANPGGGLGSSNFGYVTGTQGLTGGARYLQLGAKFSF